MKFQGFSDEALMRSISQGSPDAFDHILTRYEARLYQFALLLTQNELAAEEILISVFSALYNELQSGKVPASLEIRLFRLAIRSINHVDADAYPRSLEAVSEQLEFSCTQQQETSKGIEQLIHRLPLEYRIVSCLSDVEGMPALMIAELLEMSRGDVKRILRRSRALLRRWSKRDTTVITSPASTSGVMVTFPTVLPAD